MSISNPLLILVLDTITDMPTFDKDKGEKQMTERGDKSDSNLFVGCTT